jgi:hypothetical protein
MCDEAVTLKELGNEAFKAGSWVEAKRCYGEAIALLQGGDGVELLAALHLNMAAACMKTSSWAEAVDQATQSIAIDNTKAKAFYRRGKSLAGWSVRRRVVLSWWF